MNRKDHSLRRGLSSKKTIVRITVRASAYTVELSVNAVDPIWLFTSQGIEPCVLDGHFIGQFSVPSAEIDRGVFLHFRVLAGRMNPYR